MLNNKLYKVYLNWKAKKLSPEDPKTAEEFCEKYKCTVKDIVSFHESPTFDDDLRKAALSWLQSKIPELLHVAYDEARLSKSVSDIERLVEIAHQLKKKGETNNNQFNFFNIDAEQNRRIAERYLGRRTIGIPAGGSKE